MWTNGNRCRYNRSHLRYESNVTDEEWREIEPLFPPAKHGGNKRTVVIREVVNGPMFVLSTGCQLGAIPKDCNRRAQCTAISSAGVPTARRSGCITPYT